MDVAAPGQAHTRLVRGDRHVADEAALRAAGPDQSADE